MTGTNRSGGDRRSSGDDCFPLDGLPAMPPGFTKEEQDVWNALLEQIPEPLLRGVDVYQLETLVECIVHSRKLYKMMRDDPADLPVGRSYYQVKAHISRLSGQFGLSPIDRKKLSFSDPVEDDAAEWVNSG